MAFIREGDGGPFSRGGRFEVGGGPPLRRGPDQGNPTVVTSPSHSRADLHEGFMCSCHLIECQVLLDDFCRIMILVEV